MTPIYYKAVRPDGTDCRTGRVDYGAALLSGEPVMHPMSVRGDGYAGRYAKGARMARLAAVFRAWQEADHA